MSALAQAVPLPTEPPLLTAEEYAQLPDDGRFTELVRGRIVEMSRPTPAHGYYCANIIRALGNFVFERDLGRVVGNDSGVVTRRAPDSVRGPDVAYYSYNVVPKGPLPEGYWPAPELIFEVNSPNDRWLEVLAKVAEYLASGVHVVCVLDPDSSALHVYRPDARPEQLGLEQDLVLTELHPDFRIPVRQIFA